MASATIIKFPDGRTESKNIITSFEKNGTNVIVFETDKVDNGHKVVGISYLADGMYQNVVDASKWQEVKSYLVEILHDQITNENYCIVPNEISVTEDYIHPLGLRDENLEKIITSYEAFKSTKELASSVQEELPSLAPEVSQETVSSAPQAEINNSIDTTPIMENPIPEEKTSEMIEPIVEEQKTAEVSLDPFAIANSLEVSAQNMEEPQQEIVSQEPAPVIGGLNDNISQNAENTATSLNLSESPIMDQPEMISENIVAPQIDFSEISDIGTPSIETSEVIENNVVSPNQPAIDIAPQETIIPQPQTQTETSDLLPDTNEVAIENPTAPVSAVQNTYENAAGNIVQQARALTENYIREINELSERYIHEMEEMRSELSRNLEEAKGINELSKQTFDKAQSIAPLQEGPSLELMKAA